jgi:hypothetical protein
MAIVKMMTCVNLPPQNDLSLLCSPCIFFITLKKENQIDDILFIRLGNPSRDGGGDESPDIFCFFLLIR